MVTGTSLVAGAFIARRCVVSMAPTSFRLLMDAILVLSGLALLATALA
ncbi:MAG: hypothetical protein ABI440_15430 [Casimicrobiaceae bacterium]